VTIDNVLGDEPPGTDIDKATSKLRHGQSIMAEVGKAFGKTFTVRMKP
jgi:hypothetical protein